MHVVPPTLALPHKGGGDMKLSPHSSPSPLMGEGWGGGELEAVAVDHLDRMVMP
jgi:hypothetical protein